MANPFKTYLKKLFSDLHSVILSSLIGAIVIGVGGIWAFSKNMWFQLKSAMLYPTPLWVTGILFILLLVFFYLYKKAIIPLSKPDPEYREKFHVFWDKNYKMRCLNCGKPLKYSSSGTDPSVFFCCDPRCNSKHILKDKNNNKISEQEALDRMRDGYATVQQTGAKFPFPQWLNGEDLMKHYNLSHDLLMQHIKNGLTVYPPHDDAMTLSDDVSPMGEVDLTFLIDSSACDKCRFKKADVEAFIKKDII